MDILRYLFEKVYYYGNDIYKVNLCILLINLFGVVQKLQKVT